MNIKWYAPAKWLGLMEDLTHQYNDGYTHYTVSAKANDVFAYLTLSLTPIFFLLGFLIGRRYGAETGRHSIRITISLLLVYGVLLATGVGPYIQFYPQSSGFLDLSALEHLVDGIYCALLALCIHLGGKLGSRNKRQ